MRNGYAWWAVLWLVGCCIAGQASAQARDGIAALHAIDASAQDTPDAGRGPWLLRGDAGGNGRWRVSPVAGAGERLLVVYHPYSAQVSVAGPDGVASTRTVFDRDLDPRFSRRALVFPFHGDGPLSVRVRGARYPLRVEVGDVDAYLARDLVHVRVVSMVLGVLVGISLVVSIFWLLLRERVYLLYAATMAMQLLYLLCAYGEAYATPGLRALAFFGAPGIWTVATLSTVAASLFLIELCDLGRYAPRLARLLRWVGAWLPLWLLLVLWLPLPAGKGWFPPIGNLLLLVANVVALAGLARAWQRGNRRAAYALLGWVPLVTLSTLRALQLSAGAPLGPTIEYGLPLALALASVLLVLVLADRMLAVRRERDDAQALSERDPLTGVLNRSGIERQLSHAFDASQRGGSALSVLFLDLDHFKRINDVHGHAFGDACLRAMVRASVGQLEPSDQIGRYGGEEFLAVLPGSRPRDARDLAERIRRSVQARCATVADVPVGLTLSIGIAHDRPGDTIEELLRRADQALYAAKDAGRNQVQAAPESGP